MSVWLTIFGMALVTYATRVIPLLTMRSKFDPRLERFLSYVPPAIFAALIVPAIFAPNSSLDLGAGMAAGLLGILIAYFSRNMAVTIVAGMAVFALLRALGIPA